MCVNIDESEGDDAAKIMQDYWQTGIHNESAREVLWQLGCIENSIKKLETELTEAQGGKEPRLMAEIDGIKTELLELRRLRAICQRRLKDLDRERAELSDVEAKVSDLRIRGRQVWSDVDGLLEQLAGKVRGYLELQAEYGLLKNRFEFTTAPERWGEFPPDLELGTNLKEQIMRRVMEFTR